MAPQPAPKQKPGGGGKRGLQARLTAKVGPLPVWAWAAAILAAYFLYTKLSGGNSTATPAPATTTDTTSTDTSTGAGVTDSGGSFDTSGLEAEIGANTDQVAALGSSFDALSAQLMAAQPPSPDAGGAPSGSSPNGAAAAPTPAPAAATAAAGHLTQTTAGVLQWGGLTFTSKAAFNRWATAHGTTPAKEFATHPQAKAIYSTLK